MNWIDYEYPNTVYIVKVWYKRRYCENGDIAISKVRCKDMPKLRNNSKVFEIVFCNHEQAIRYARFISYKLEIPFPGGFNPNSKPN